MATNEFNHQGCNRHDPDNCSACALTDLSQESPNYAGWPLAYMENGRAIPDKWIEAFCAEFHCTDNALYVANLRRTLEKYGAHDQRGKMIVVR